MIAYLVNGKTFYNTYLAAHESYKSGQPVQFYCNDHEYDQLNWNQEPAQSFSDLCRDYAVRLRNQYQRLILLYSGGTDSHTIYRTFVDNKIHLDEIIIKISDNNPAYPDTHLKWLLKNHPDPTTKITYYDGNEDDLRAREITDDNWIFENRGEIYKFGMPVAARGVQHLCERNHAGHTWTAITGMEKPRLIYRNGAWYSRQLDIVLRQVMGYNYVTNFYLEPTIHLKQSHLVKRAVKKLIADNNLPLWDNDWAEAKWPKTADGYQAWAVATGRCVELTPGVSFLQKQINDQVFGTETAKLTNASPEKIMQELYHRGDAVARNYINGFNNLLSEHAFAGWLNQEFLKNPGSNQLSNTRFIWSKEYNLGN